MPREKTEHTEEQTIRLTETWMHNNSRLFRMPWLVLSANVAVTPRYALRYFFAMFARIIVMFVLVFSACTFVSIALDPPLRNYYQRIFSVANHLSSADARFMIDGLWHMGLVVLLFALFLSVTFTMPLARYARHWNRRARRLQLNPPALTSLMPGVWPPPPRI